MPAAAVATADEVAAIATSVAAVQGGKPIVTEIAQTVATGASDVAAGKGLNDVATSVIRTLVPIAVGGGLTLLGTSAGIHVPAEYNHVVDEVATLVIGGAYYGIVRGLEAKFPRLGWFLGVPRKPVYSA